jgi:hypothetical protein
MSNQIIEPVNQVLRLLAAGKYADLEILTHGLRLTAKEMEKAVDDYGRKLVLPPDACSLLEDVVEVKNAKPKRWSVAMPLWTREEGRSDLTVEMTIVEQQNGFAIELDDIHVL